MLAYQLFIHLLWCVWLLLWPLLGLQVTTSAGLVASPNQALHLKQIQYSPVGKVSYI